MIPDYEQQLDALFIEAFPCGSPAVADWAQIKFELQTRRKEMGGVRKEVVEFARMMERVLRENDHKSGWDVLNITELFLMITREYDEAHMAYSEYIDSGDEHHIQNLCREAIDIANCCMFLCHNYSNEVR